MDDFGGNRLLRALGGLAFQLLHHLRRQLSGPLRYAQPRSLRTRLFDGPAKFTDTDGGIRLQLPASRWEGSLLLRLLEGLTGERGPPDLDA